MGLWEHSIDGVDINDLEAFATSVPEVQSRFGAQVLMTDMQARTPVFNRQQPVAGRYTFLTYVIAQTDEDYQARLAILRALVGPGIHTWVWKAPGEASSHTALVYFETGLVTDDTGYGPVTAKAIAPDPVFA
jgi:hypothetical protein